MKTMFYCLVFVLIMVVPINNAYLDLTKTNKHGGTMNTYVCNKDTVIDFRFSPSTTITCTSSSCTTTSPQLSTVRFLDVGGSEQTYTLQNLDTSIYKISDTASRSEEKAMIKLMFLSTSGKILYIGIPFSTNASPSAIYEVNLQSLGDSAWTNLKSATSVTSLPLSTLNVFNQRDWGHFYHIANDAKSPALTYLLGYFVLSNSKIDLTSIPSDTYDIPDSALLNITDDVYKSTGDKICWGSGSEGIFQTHLRQSYPLWTAWIGILFFWLYNLLSESNQINCYDKKYQDNKWTCWGFYSLHFLGHEEYFTKLSRATLMLITFSWQGCVLGILYYNIPPGKGPVMILWAAVIAVFTAMPFTYAMGYFFMRKIYQLTLHKYNILKEMKGVFNKKDIKMQTLDKQIDDTEESLYGYYYWYYVLAFCFFVAFWVIATHQMMQIHRDYYYFMYYWLASVGVALGLEHLFLDPILTFILGNTAFYRVRGFYYDYNLGERFKEIQE